MIPYAQKLFDQYIAWLREKTKVRQLKNWVEITTPYLDRHNDYLQIYAKYHNGTFVLTDDGHTINDLERSGYKLDRQKRKNLLETILKGFGVTLNGRALEVHATRDSFPLRKHNLIQAMLAVNDMFYLATPTVTSLFFEDVLAWLKTNKIHYAPKVKFAGKSGYDHLFDFVIPRSRVHPERIVSTVNRPSKDAVLSIVFAWVDTRDVRSPNSRAYAVLNDSGRTVSSDVTDALKSYEIRPVLWTQRDDVREELAA